jgi:hypothetical protein
MLWNIIHLDLDAFFRAVVTAKGTYNHPDRLEYAPGKRCAVKVARTVWWGADGKGSQRHLASRLPNSILARVAYSIDMTTLPRT